MSKHYTKRYLMFSLILCLIFSSISTFGSGTSDLDRTLNNSYDSLSNIQKQLRVLTKNTYVNIVNGTSNDVNLSQLSIYSNQLSQVKTNLSSVSTKNITKPQSSKLQSLITISSYLTFIQGKIEEYLSSTTASEQYEIIDAISVANSLVNQIFSYVPQQ